MDLRDEGDGGGWVLSEDGSRRWGLRGAAGLLLRAPNPDSAHDPLVLLQHRAAWTNAGDTWALPGGAIDSHETPAEAACRETEEETGIPPTLVRVRGGRITSRAVGLPHPRAMVGGRPNHAGLPADLSADEPVEWTYTTVFADADSALETTANHESVELRWVPESQVAAMPLMPAFAESWPTLRAASATVVLDMANIVGSRGRAPAPDQPWWRDPAGATESLLGQVEAAFPFTLLDDDAALWCSRPLAVVEGRARGAVFGGAVERVDAPGAGDHEIVARAESVPRDQALVVVTSDRGLRARLPERAVVLGSGRFLRLLEG